MGKNNRSFIRSHHECRQVGLVDKTESLIYQDTLRRFTSTVASLSSTEQHLFYLRYYQELSLQESVNRYSLSTRAIKRRLERIDSKLERCFIHQLAS